MATAYLTAAGLEEIIGREALLAAAGDPTTPGAVDAARVAGAIEEVSARVDARLRAYYTLPLPDVPGFLRRAVARIVHAELCNEAASTDLIQSRRDASEQIVRDLAAGKMRVGGDLDGDGAANQRTGQGRASVVRPVGRRFSAGDTAGIV